MSIALRFARALHGFAQRQHAKHLNRTVRKAVRKAEFEEKFHSTLVAAAQRQAQRVDQADYKAHLVGEAVKAEAAQYGVKL